MACDLNTRRFIEHRFDGGNVGDDYLFEIATPPKNELLEVGARVWRRILFVALLDSEEVEPVEERVLTGPVARLGGGDPSAPLCLGGWDNLRPSTFFRLKPTMGVSSFHPVDAQDTAFPWSRVRTRDSLPTACDSGSRWAGTPAPIRENPTASRLQVSSRHAVPRDRSCAVTSRENE